MPCGTTPSLFHTWVFPCCTRMEEWRNQTFCKNPKANKRSSSWSSGLQSLKGGVLSQGQQCRHEWVALLATFCLHNGVNKAVLVFPRIGRRSVELPHEWQCCISSNHCVKALQHRRARDHVKGPDPIDRQHVGVGIEVRQCLDGVSHALCACSRRQRRLKRTGGAFDLRPTAESWSWQRVA